MTPFTGEIRMFAGSTLPFGWLACDGSPLPVKGNEALFALLGSIYGGDDKTWFALPDLRTRVPIGVGCGFGLSPYLLGESTGADYVQLQEANLPSHRHFFAASTEAADTTSPGNAATFGSVGGVTVQTAGATQPLMIYQDPPTSPSVALNPATIGTVAGNPHPNLMPSFSVIFMICGGGVFPVPAN